MICVLCGKSICAGMLSFDLYENTGGFTHMSKGQYTGYSAHKMCTKIDGEHPAYDKGNLRAIIAFNLLAQEED